MLVNGQFALLPTPVPIPSLVGRHRYMGAQFNDSFTRNDLDLRAGLVKPELAPNISGQGDIAPLIDSPEPRIHDASLPRIPNFRNSVFQQICNGLGLPRFQHDLDQLPADGTQRLVIRPPRPTLITFGVIIGTVTLLGAGVKLNGRSLVPVLVWLGIGGLFMYGLYRWHLWVDSERVGVSRLPWGASCRRDQLDRLQIIFAGRGGSTCDFVRKDGRTAFRVSAKPFGATQLKALARSLGVPYYDLFSGSSIDIPPGG